MFLNMLAFVILFIIAIGMVGMSCNCLFIFLGFLGFKDKESRTGKMISGIFTIISVVATVFYWYWLGGCAGWWM